MTQVGNLGVSFSSSYSLSTSKWSLGLANSHLKCHSSPCPPPFPSATVLIRAFSCPHCSAWHSPSNWSSCLNLPSLSHSPSHFPVPPNSTIKVCFLTSVILLFPCWYSRDGYSHLISPTVQWRLSLLTSLFVDLAEPQLECENFCLILKRQWTYFSNEFKICHIHFKTLETYQICFNWTAVKWSIEGKRFVKNHTKWKDPIPYPMCISEGWWIPFGSLLHFLPWD